MKFFPAGADLRGAEHEKRTLRFEQIVNDPNMKVAALAPVAEEQQAEEAGEVEQEKPAQKSTSNFAAKK